MLVSCVVAISIFLNPRLELDREKYAVRDNLYSLCCDHIPKRFAALYQSFATVIGAQIVISAINTLWLTLLALVLGEKLIGLPGMILAPVVLNYVRMEASRIEVKPQLDPSGNPV